MGFNVRCLNGTATLQISMKKLKQYISILAAFTIMLLAVVNIPQTNLVETLSSTVELNASRAQDTRWNGRKSTNVTALFDETLSETTYARRPPDNASDNVPSDSALDSILPRTIQTPYAELNSEAKYLLYTPSGGIGNQLICLCSAIFTAKTLGRGLIVPMISGHINLAPRYLTEPAQNLIAADRLLDLAMMSKTTGVELVPLDISLADFVNGTAPAGLEVVPIADPFIGKGWGYANAFKQRLKASTSRIVYLHGRFFGYQWLRYETWSAMHFAPSLQKIAALVHQQIFHGKNFNALQIRMGDISGRITNTTKYVEGFIQGATAAQFETQTPLYIATEAKQKSKFFAPLYSQFPHYVHCSSLKMYPRIRSTLEKLELALAKRTKVLGTVYGMIDQLICTLANRFVGTSTSTFTKTITVLRRNLQLSLTNETLQQLDLSFTHRITSSVHSDGRVTTWAWQNGTETWHDERWFMKVSQLDRGPNKANYVT
mmetsp:Transcript_6037/g.12285  ORF Transcript_6037/g.12285 Transcript_6037/m.12285 type:complete len:488 (-) Transcript_6037:148-1611(-)